MCKVLQVSPNAYYNYLKNKDKNKNKDKDLENLIEKIFYQSRSTYGSRRIKAVLKSKHGINVSRKKISKIMKQKGLVAKTKGSKKPKTTRTVEGEKYVPNIINREFKAKRPHEKYTSDITYVKAGNRYLYLYTTLDIFTRKIVAWNLSNTLQAQEAITMLKAIEPLKEEIKGAIFHSDRGVQYTSQEFKNYLKQLGMEQSMSDKGNCYDNAIMESFFATLKTELKEEFSNEYEAYLLIGEYINWYNNIRIHSALGYKSPSEFELEFHRILCTK